MCYTEGRSTFVVPQIFDQLRPVIFLSAERCVASTFPYLFDQLEPVMLFSAEQRVISVVPHTLDLSDCSELVDVSCLSSQTLLKALHLGCGGMLDQASHIVDVSPISSLVSLETLHS